jgi:hypothetical protein
MPLAITLRCRPDVSPFRRQLLRLIRTPGANHLFLCSGFFSPHILDDELLAAMNSHCNQVVVIGGYLKDENGNLDPEKQTKFDTFVMELRKSHSNVVQYQADNLAWHSKIALRLRKNRPIAAIIGSSNLTWPSVSESETSTLWNYESDVTIWLPEDDLEEHFRKVEHDTNPDEVAIAVLDPSARQPTEAERLQTLFDELNRLKDKEKLTKRELENRSRTRQSNA